MTRKIFLLCCLLSPNIITCTGSGVTSVCTDTSVSLSLNEHYYNRPNRMGYLSVYRLINGNTTKLLLYRLPFEGPNVTVNDLKPASFYLINVQLQGAVSGNFQIAPISHKQILETLPERDNETFSPHLVEVARVAFNGTTISVSLKSSGQFQRLISMPRLLNCTEFNFTSRFMGHFLDPVAQFDFEIEPVDYLKYTSPKCEQICVHNWILFPDPDDPNRRESVYNAPGHCEEFGTALQRSELLFGWLRDETPKNIGKQLRFIFMNAFIAVLLVFV